MASSDPDDSHVVKLREEIAAERRRHSAGLARLKECSAKAAEDIPADSKVFRLSRNNGADAPDARTSSTHELDPEARLKKRQERAAAVRTARASGIARLKKTTMQAVHQVRETSLMNGDALKKRLAKGPEAPTNET